MPRSEFDEAVIYRLEKIEQAIERMEHEALPEIQRDVTALKVSVALIDNDAARRSGGIAGFIASLPSAIAAGLALYFGHGK